MWNFILIFLSNYQRYIWYKWVLYLCIYMSDFLWRDHWDGNVAKNLYFDSKIIQIMEHYEVDMLWNMWFRVKIEICGLYYHPSNPSLFCGFFFWSFQFFITLVYNIAH